MTGFLKIFSMVFNHVLIKSKLYVICFFKIWQTTYPFPAIVQLLWWMCFRFHVSRSLALSGLFLVWGQSLCSGILPVYILCLETENILIYFAEMFASVQCFRYFSFCVLIIWLGLSGVWLDMFWIVKSALKPAGWRGFSRGREALGILGLCYGGSLCYYF